MSQRVVHCQHSSYDVYVGRGRCPKTSMPSIFGNPFGFRNSPETGIFVKLRSREAAVEAYRDWIYGRKWREVEPERRLQIIRALPSLTNKVLACWCAPQLCHGEVLDELANESPVWISPGLFVDIYQAIEHGDVTHRKWLRDKLNELAGERKLILI